jgi:hypothetical protein
MDIGIGMPEFIDNTIMEGGYFALYALIFGCAVSYLILVKCITDLHEAERELEETRDLRDGKKALLDTYDDLTGGKDR